MGDEQYDKINTLTLTDAQFTATKRIMRKDIAVNALLGRTGELIDAAKDEITKLPYRKFNFEQYEKSLGAWGKYKFLSFGHPSMVELHDSMIANGGTLSVEETKMVVHYMKQLGYFQFPNPTFKEALKWLMRMNWTFESELAEDVYAKGLREYFETLLHKYENISAVIEDEDTLQRCEY